MTDFATLDSLTLETLPAADSLAASTAPVALVKGSAPVPVAVLLDADYYNGQTLRLADRGLRFLTAGPAAVIGYSLPNEFFSNVHNSDVHTAYQQRILDQIEISETALDAAEIGGRSALTAGRITLRNEDRVLDPIAQLGEALGRSVTVKTVAAPSPSASDVGGSLAAAVTVFKGVTAAFGAADTTIQLQVSDLTEKLAQPFQPHVYDGSGYINGSSDLKGRPKPVAFGFCFNITPVYLGLVDFGNGALPTYQSNWRDVLAHDAVRTRGALASQTGTVPGIGEYRDWPVFGCFQIGFTADGAITCDVRGDAPGGLYAGSTAGIVERVLTGGYGPQLVGSDLDSDSFARVAAQLPGEIGWYSGTEDTTGQSVLDAVLFGGGAILAGARNGTLHLAALAVSNSTVMFDLDAYDIVSLKPADLPASLQPTPSLIEIAAQKNWTVLSDIAGSVTGAARDAIAGQGRTVSAIPPNVVLRQTTAQKLSFAGLYRYETDALTRAQQFAAWVDGGLKMFEITTDKYLNQIRIGHYGRVTYPRFGLDAGFLGVIVAWHERPGDGRVTFTMIG